MTQVRELLSFIYRILCSLSQRIIVFGLRSRRQDGFVYMFHEINDETKGNFSITIDCFKKFVETVNRDCHFITCEELEKEDNYDTKEVLISFDDAYEDVYLNAYPVLKRMGIPFTIFISSEFIGKAGYLTEEEIKIISSDSLCTIGGHLEKHVPSRSMSNEELCKLMFDNNETLYRITGKEVKYFAFPYGSVYCVSKKNILSAGKIYNMVFTTYDAGFNYKHIRKAKYVPRVNVCTATALKLIKRWEKKQREFIG